MVVGDLICLYYHVVGRLLFGSSTTFPHLTNSVDMFVIVVPLDVVKALAFVAMCDAVAGHLVVVLAAIRFNQIAEGATVFVFDAVHTTSGDFALAGFGCLCHGLEPLCVFLRGLKCASLSYTDYSTYVASMSIGKRMNLGQFSGIVNIAMSCYNCYVSHY